MRKDKLIEFLKNNQEHGIEGTKFIGIFQKFMESKCIKYLPNDANIAFKDFSNFLLQTYQSPSEQDCNLWMFQYESCYPRIIKKFLLDFNEDKTKKTLALDNVLKYQFNNVFDTNIVASTLAILPNDNFLTGLCYFNEQGIPTGGGIFLYDNKGNLLKTLTNEPASALTILPNGQILSSTCYFNKRGYTTGGSIVLRDSDGNYIKTLIDEPASCLAILPNGQILSSTNCFDKDGYSREGRIVLRDSDGNYIKTLRKEPASGLAILPNGYFLSSRFFYYKKNRANSWRYSERNSNDYFHKKQMVMEGDISLHSQDGSYYEFLTRTPASALGILPNNNFLITTCHFNKPKLSKEMGGIKCKKLKLISENKKSESMWDSIYNSVIDRAAMACIQFHKGLDDPTSDVAKLNKDVLSIIYSYVFPFPDAKKNVIKNPYGLPPKANNIKEELLANVFAKKIMNLKFFQKPVVTTDIVSNPKKHEVKRRKFKTCNII